MTIDELLKTFSGDGVKFERLMKNFLPMYYRGEVKNVVCWNEFSSERDLGIDLVIETLNGEFWAVQCKFYAAHNKIDKAEVDSFISNSGRTFDGKKFSRRIFISTSDNFTDNALKMFENQSPPVVRINMGDLRNAGVDWAEISRGVQSKITRGLRDYQQIALGNAVAHFKTNERGQLIMACGTGKTFTALRIAENLTGNSGLTLFFVPSLSLIKQALREWCNFAEKPINAVCVCSDKTVAVEDAFQDVNLPVPVTNQPEEISAAINRKGNFGMTVVFSTYQSVQKVIDANLDFDLVICDEAHRTAGNGKNAEDRLFSLVHNNEKIKSRRRLYMTATPKLYTETGKNVAAANDFTVWSMDNEEIFGAEFYKISFKEAIRRNLLSDYQLLIFEINDDELSGNLRENVFKIIEELKEEITKSGQKEVKISFTVDDAAKIVGCINALSKRVTEDSKNQLEGDLQQMHKAVAFLPNIATSKFAAEFFNRVQKIYAATLEPQESAQLVEIHAEHIDGSTKAAAREEALNRLAKTPTDGKACSIVSNVRCLSEGVDVPSLDAVIFLSPKKSKVDIVQAVGRALRKFDGKKFGYIIVPIIAPKIVNGETRDYYSKNNERYRTVYEVVQALKAHDDAMNADVERLSVGGKAKKIKVGRTIEFDKCNPEIPFDIFKNDVIARVVEMNGNKGYWWQWADKVSKIVERHTARIRELVAGGGAPQATFQNFLRDLQKIINPAITENDAVDMLAQHLVTRPVFEALFENYSFAQKNAVSKAMTEILRRLDESTLHRERAELKDFYATVQESCRDMGDAKNRQRIITDLYDNFFKMALPLTAQKLGIVYTPVEVVDFIIHSVNDVLRENFGKNLADENVHIIDPFVGTGTFITLLIQSGLIDRENLIRKYQSEIHANEIVLLAYYIAAINIENAWHQGIGESEEGKVLNTYTPFSGICLADTFQSYENAEDPAQTLAGFENPLRENAELIKKQLGEKITIIIGNPPYSVGQRSANDNAQNVHYEKLERRIAETYAKATNATNKNALYDSYIKAFRWASDRIADGGIIAFVTNAGWIDGAAMDGLRNCFAQEFSKIYIFNLRGNARTQGELRRKERDNVFGQGSRAPIAITVLVKNPAANSPAEIHYCDIGDYLSREEKLARIAEFQSVLNMPAQIITPNEKHDWINQRGNSFDKFIILGDKKNPNAKSFFSDVSNGLQTNRDVWCYNYSYDELVKNMSTTISFYNKHTTKDTDAKKISWSSSLENYSTRGLKFRFDTTKIVEGMYRPFCKEYLYFGEGFIHRRGQMDNFFPTGVEENLLICVPGLGENKDFSVIMTDKISDVGINGAARCFPLYWYSETPEQNIFEPEKVFYARRSGITDWIFERAQAAYGDFVTREDIFYYVYGFLHMPAYRAKFAAELKKSLPRIFLVDSAADFWKLSRAGRALAEIHLNYERQEPTAGVRIIGEESGDYRVRKMRFNKERTEIIYNERIKIAGIPARANEYVVNGRSPLEWIVERYQIKTDKASGIVNDPNDWCAEHNAPRYILDLIMSCITVSLKTLDIVDALPEIKFE